MKHIELTREIAKTLKPGTKLLTTVDWESDPWGTQGKLVKGEIRVFKGLAYANASAINLKGSTINWNTIGQFALADKKEIRSYWLNKLIKKANEGRECANELIDEYADEIEIVEGKYIIKAVK